MRAIGNSKKAGSSPNALKNRIKKAQKALEKPQASRLPNNLADLKFSGQMQEALLLFESACIEFQVSKKPQFLLQKNPQTRKHAEQILSAFARKPNMIPTCKYILGKDSRFNDARKYSKSVHAVSRCVDAQASLCSGICDHGPIGSPEAARRVDWLCGATC